MTIEVAWADDARTIIVLNYQPGWTWADFREALQRVGELNAGITHPFYIINDVRSAPKMPDGQAISHFRAAGQNNAPNLRYIYIVGTNMLATSLLSSMQKLVPLIAQTWRVVSTMEETYAMIDADKQSQTNR